MDVFDELVESNVDPKKKHGFKSIQSFSEMGLAYDCGVHQKTTTSVENGNAVFTMDGLQGIRHSKITCHCGEGDVYDFVGENPTGNYQLKLTSKACCPGGGGGGGSSGLSPGSVLLIIVLCLVIVYLVAGILVQTGLRHAQGRERIPHVAFWTAVPGLVVDGFRFTFTGGRLPAYGEV